MSITVKFEGLRDIERALAKLPAGTAKGVARRAMKKELKPVADLANALWPGAQDDVVKVTSRISRSQPQPKKGRSIVNLAVGAGGRHSGTPHAHLVEWGTGPRFWRNGKYTGMTAPQPFLAPAWDAHRAQMLERLGARLWDEIQKSMARRAAKGKV